LLEKIKTKEIGKLMIKPWFTKAVLAFSSTKKSFLSGIR